MTVTCLLDADITAYGIAAASQTVTQFPGCEPSIEVEPLEDVLTVVDKAIDAAREQVGADKVIVCLSVPTIEGWRLAHLPTYKAGRPAKPVLLGAIKQYMVEHHDAQVRPTLEADDVMGILSTHPKAVPGKRVIYSIDKDMKTIPGWLFNPDKDMVPQLIEREEADWWHLYQSLVGDSTDNYKGLRGCGDVGARKLLGVPGSLSVKDAWARIVEAYEAKGYTEAEALIQARVARICRARDYDFKNRKVIPWSP